MSASQQKLINLDVARVDAEEIRQAVEFQAAILADMAERRGTLHGRVKPLAPHMATAGSAITVEVHPGGNFAIHVTTTVAKPGDMLVIDGRGDLSCALLGEIMATQIQTSGITGIIIDGVARDAEALSNQRFPVSTAGLNPCGPIEFIPGRVNHAISVGGAVVQAGDSVVGDIDSVVIILRNGVRTITELAKGKLATESKRLVAIRDSDLRPHWLKSALRQAGVPSEGGTLPRALETSS